MKIQVEHQIMTQKVLCSWAYQYDLDKIYKMSTVDNVHILTQLLRLDILYKFVSD